MKTHTSKILGTVILSVVVVGCTRLGSNGSVQLSIANQITMQKVNSKLGDVSTQSYSLSHVVVNATGEGLPAALLIEKDDCRDCATSTPIGDVVIEDIPAGQKLIQVLAVYADSTTGEMLIKYGDASLNVSSGENTVSVTTGSLASGALISGQLNGRYMTGANTGPTGTLLTKFKPVDKPAMIVTRTSISAGWFSTLIMEGVNFTYEVINLDGSTTTIFDNVSSSSPAFVAASNVARVRFPPHFRQSGGGGTWRAEQEKHLIFGFWGSPVDSAAKRVCYYTSDLATQMNYRATDNAGSSKLWYVAGSVAANNVTVTGGQNSEGAECTPWLADRPANLYNNMLELTKNNLDQNGGSQVSGLQGIFGIQNFSTDRFVSASYPDSSSINLKTALLPGVSNALYDSVVAYKKVNVGEFYFHSDSVPCDKLAEGKIPGFSLAGEVNLPVSGSTLAISIALAKADRSNLNVALCPKKSGKTVLGGVFLGNYWLKAKYIKASFGSAAGTSGNQLTRGYCHPVTLQVMEGNDESTMNDAATLNLTSMASTHGTFSVSGSCSTPATGTSISGSASGVPMYFKPSIVGSGVTISMASDNPAIGFDSSPTYTVLDPKLTLLGPDRIIPGICYNYKLRAQTALGVDIPSPATLTPSTTATGFTYLDGNSDCSTATPISLSSGSPEANVYFKVGASPTSYNLDFSSAGFTTASKAIAVGVGGQIIEFIDLAAANPPLILNQCNLMVLRLKNRDGAIIPAPYARTFALAVDPDLGTFFADSNCNNVDNKVSMAVNQLDGIVYFKPRKGDVSTNLVINFGVLNSPYPFTGNAATVPGTVAVTSPTAPAPYLFLSAPSFNGKMIIGSHEFGAQRLVPITKSTGAVIECSTDNISYGSCSGVIDGSGNYIWTISDATTDMQRWFRIANSAAPAVLFRGSTVYGTGFKVLTCATDMASNFNFPTFNSLITGTTCIGSGITISGSCGSGVVLGSGSISIVGHSDGTSVIDAGSCTTAAAVSITGSAFNDANQTRYLANLKILNVSGSGAGIDLSSVTSTFSTSRILVSGNDITSTSANAALKIGDLNDIDVSVDLFANKVTLSGGSANVGLDVVNHFGGYVAYNDNLVISTSSIGVGVRNLINASIANGGPLNIDNYKFTGQGQALMAYGFASYTATTVLTNSDISISGYSGTGSAIVSDYLSVMTLQNNRIVGESSTTNSGGLLKVNNVTTSLWSNIFVQNSSLDFIRLMGSSLISNLDDNQFVYKGGGAPPTALNGTGQSAVGALATDHGRNLFCAGGTAWSSLFSYASIHGSHTFNHTNALSKCMKTNDVSPRGICMSPCDP